MNNAEKKRKTKRQALTGAASKRENEIKELIKIAFKRSAWEVKVSSICTDTDKEKHRKATVERFKVREHLKTKRWIRNKKRKSLREILWEERNNMDFYWN